MKQSGALRYHIRSCDPKLTKRKFDKIKFRSGSKCWLIRNKMSINKGVDMMRMVRWDVWNH